MTRASSQEGIPILSWCKGNYVSKGTEMTTGFDGHVVVLQEAEGREGIDKVQA